MQDTHIFQKSGDFHCMILYNNKSVLGRVHSSMADTMLNDIIVVVATMIGCHANSIHAQHLAQPL